MYLSHAFIHNIKYTVSPPLSTTRNLASQDSAVAAHRLPLSVPFLTQASRGLIQPRGPGSSVFDVNKLKLLDSRFFSSAFSYAFSLVVVIFESARNAYSRPRGPSKAAALTRRQKAGAAEGPRAVACYRIHTRRERELTNHICIQWWSLHFYYVNRPPRAQPQASGHLLARRPASQQLEP